MTNRENIHAILERTMMLSSSYAAAPYSVSSISITEKFRELDSALLTKYNDAILISIWEDYTSSDAGEYIGLSKECLSIEDDDDREVFVQKRLTTVLKDPETFEDWKERQSYFVLGLVISSSRQKNYDPKPLDINELNEGCRNELIRITAGNLKPWYIVLL